MQNHILDEIHRIREEHAKSFNYDLDAMFADWQKKQTGGGREVVSLYLANRSQGSDLG
jgi:hypothetical protein